MSHVTQLLEDKQADENLKEQLQLLVTLAKSKLEIMTTDIENAFLNKETEQKFRVVPGTSTEWITEYRVNAGSECSAQIGEVIDAFFEGDMVEGFKKLISTSLNSFIGERTAGEQAHKYYFITMEHNTIIRVDVACWKYQFSSTQVITNVENAFCYSFCKSVVDYSTVSTTLLLNQISKIVGDNIDLIKDYMTKIKEVLKMVEEFSTNSALKDDANKLSINMNPGKEVVEKLQASMKNRYSTDEIFK